ncbi:hypothetical protein PROPEN_02911 [Proteus penneri ATCC 35198]|nr:hypothetical protein PROPEN_02911 [Proteus penneri ATCC 35198]
MEKVFSEFTITIKNFRKYYPLQLLCWYFFPYKVMAIILTY